MNLKIVCYYDDIKFTTDSTTNYKIDKKFEMENSNNCRSFEFELTKEPEFKLLWISSKKDSWPKIGECKVNFKPFQLNYTHEMEVDFVCMEKRIATLYYDLTIINTKLSWVNERPDNSIKQSEVDEGLCKVTKV